MNVAVLVRDDGVVDPDSLRGYCPATTAGAVVDMAVVGGIFAAVCTVVVGAGVVVVTAPALLGVLLAGVVVG